MKTAGIVAEYNPFHIGHAWQIAATRRILGEEAGIVCVMSGHWVQGADCAIADKWTRAGLALEGGADLVLELPTVWALSSAEPFARGAVALLAATGVVDYLSFGSEAGVLDGLTATAACLDSADYQEELRRLVGQGLPFAAARQRAAERLLGPAAQCLSSPNNNLGVEYLRAIRAQACGLTPLTVPRRGAAHGGGVPEGGFASATAVRRLLRAGELAAASRYLRPGALAALDGKLACLERLERAVLARLRCMGPGDWARLPDSGAAEGLPGRLCRAAAQACSTGEFFSLAKTKRYTHARLRRLALWALLEMEEKDRPPAPPYLRVLGANKRGRVLLREMGERAALPVLTKTAHVERYSHQAQALFRLEARCTDLYALCLPQVGPCGQEWSRSPVMVL